MANQREIIDLSQHSDSDSDDDSDSDSPAEPKHTSSLLENKKTAAKSSTMEDSDSESSSDSDDYFYDENDDLEYQAKPVAQSPDVSGIKRARGRRDALIPNTMTARLCEQAVERFEMQKVAAEKGIEIDDEELDLCGIEKRIGAAGAKSDGGYGEEDEEDSGDDIRTSKRKKKI